MNRGQFPKPCSRPHPGKGLARLSGRTIICRNTHHIMYATGSHPESRAEVSPGRPRTHPYPSTCPRTPATPTVSPGQDSNALTSHSRHK
jgi:hypothetical protein